MWLRCLVLVAFVVALSALPLNVLAQESPVGKKVHVATFAGGKQTGKLVSLDTASVVVRQGRDTVTIPLRDVRRIDPVTHEVLYGALSGLAIGFTLGKRACTATSCDPGEDNLVGMFYGAVGAAVGAGIGRIVKGMLRARSHCVPHQAENCPHDYADRRQGTCRREWFHHLALRFC